MKNLITTMACLMVLLAMLMEFTHSQVLYSRIMAADQAVNCFRETARAEGRITEHNAGWLREELAAILHCGKEEVEISGTRQAVSQGERISYSIKAPAGDALAMPGFWDIGEDESRFSYQVRQSVTSVGGNEAAEPGGDSRSGAGEGGGSVEAGGKTGGEGGERP